MMVIGYSNGDGGDVDVVGSGGGNGDFGSDNVRS